MKRGKFYVLEGLDKVGKTTQAEKLGKKLNGKVEKFPYRTSEIGQILNKHLTNEKKIECLKTEHLLMAANRAEREEEIIKTLKNGVDVIADRFYASGVAYTSAKGINGTTFQTNEDLYNWAKMADWNIIEPDITFYFKSETGFKEKDDINREIYENVTFQNKVDTQFEKIKNEKKNWLEIKVDAYKNKVEELTEELFRIVEEDKKTENSLHFNTF